MISDGLISQGLNVHRKGQSAFAPSAAIRIILLTCCHYCLFRQFAKWTEIWIVRPSLLVSWQLSTWFFADGWTNTQAFASRLPRRPWCLVDCWMPVCSEYGALLALLSVDYDSINSSTTPEIWGLSTAMQNKQEQHKNISEGWTASNDLHIFF